MGIRFDLARLDSLIGRRVEILRHETHAGQVGQVIDVTTTIPVKLRKMVMEEDRDWKDLRAEYGRRIHLHIKLDRGEEVFVTWEDVEILD